MHSLTTLTPDQPADLIWKDPADEFVYFLAHEVRNPLNNIKLSIEVLKAAGLKENFSPYLEIISRNTMRIDGLIDDLLRHQESEVVKMDAYPVYQMLEDVLEAAADRIRLKNVAVVKSYNADDHDVYTNLPRIKMAITNIVVNAIEAMYEEKGELKLVTNENENNYVVSVQDNGCGISKEHLAFIFQPYFSHKPGGLGIGLSTTYDIFRSNKIGVSVASEPGVGTQFDLFFPKHKAK